MSWQRFAIPLLTAVVSTALLLSTGCDPTVDVLRPSDQFRYSLFGALNVAADTQVIRVEMLGDTTQIGAPPTLDAMVLLKNRSTGEQVRLDDSLARVGTKNVLVHNFWTTHPIQPATSYRIAVREDEDAVTTAATTTPSRPPDLSHGNDFLLPCIYPRTPVNQRKPQNTFTVIARDVERVAAADVIYPITLPTNQGPVRTLNDFSHYESVEERSDESFLIPIFYRRELTNLNPDPPPGPQQECAGFEEFTHPHALVAVSSGGPDWPEGWRGVPFSQISSPDSFSNVDGGHGFVGGIYSDTIKVPLRRR